ncbi:MAG: hypothetical protein IKQ39_04845 [Oscillospiraceae bacterium]|nr:hypothetical protein [Oscillospiraceae bacterium]
MRNQNSRLRLYPAVCAAAMLLCCTGCGGADSSSTESSAAENGLKTVSAEGVDAGCADCIKAYFEAIEAKDYEAYVKTIYPPYKETYDKLLNEKGDKPEDDFAELCTRFDEDGYESWHLTDLTLSYYEKEDTGIDKFFDRYVQGGVFDAQFVTDCKADAAEIHDVIFTLSALYKGDAEPVTVVDGAGILAVKNKEGWFVFG